MYIGFYHWFFFCFPYVFLQPLANWHKIYSQNGSLAFLETIISRNRKVLEIVILYFKQGRLLWNMPHLRSINRYTQGNDGEKPRPQQAWSHRPWPVGIAELGGVKDGYMSVKGHDDHRVDADEDGQEANYSVGLTQAVWPRDQALVADDA